MNISNSKRKWRVQRAQAKNKKLLFEASSKYFKLTEMFMIQKSIKQQNKLVMCL